MGGDIYSNSAEITQYAWKNNQKVVNVLGSNHNGLQESLILLQDSQQDNRVAFQKVAEQMRLPDTVKPLNFLITWGSLLPTNRSRIVNAAWVASGIWPILL